MKQKSLEKSNRIIGLIGASFKAGSNNLGFELRKEAADLLRIDWK